MFKRSKKNKLSSLSAISPDEVFLDSQNIPDFDSHQLEGRMEQPLSQRTFCFIGLVFLFLAVILIGKTAYLQIITGEVLAARAENNRLRQIMLQPERGLIYDRRGELLAWNEAGGRTYKNLKGLSHVLGYTGEEFGVLKGKSGVEKSYNEFLRGQMGVKIIEVNSKNEIESENIQLGAQDGRDLHLYIDAELQQKFYEIFAGLASERDFAGAAGVILDVDSGEVLALVSYPEYSSQILSQGWPEEEIEAYRNNAQKPFLNRALSGLYAPGSVIKPFIALAALNEGVISPEKEIFSSGSISIPHPYFPGKKSIFYDWKAHGFVDMRRALAVSSNVYFYTIGGGYEDVSGLGIKRIQKYLKNFGLGSRTNIDLGGEALGVVPGDSVWRIGDTYNVSIGQGNLQVTPLQMATAMAILANGGHLIQPLVSMEQERGVKERSLGIEIKPEHFRVVREGMRQAVLEGTAKALAWLPIEMAAKTGTAELGSGQFVNSWLIGFWPYKNPRFVLSIVLEKGRASNLIGGVFATRQLMEWMIIHRPEYLTSD
jgi:penicillin-binding protein 2